MIRILVIAFCFLIAVSSAEPQRLAIETSEGRIEVEVWPDVAPQTVKILLGWQLAPRLGRIALEIPKRQNLIMII